MQNGVDEGKRKMFGLAALGGVALLTQRSAYAACPANPPPDGKFVSVKDYYGGTGDYTQAFNNAIVGLASVGGGAIYVPSGCYAISGKVTLNASNIKIFGNGVSSIISFSGSGWFKLNYSDGAEFCGLKFDGSGTAVLISSGPAVPANPEAAYGAKNLSIHNCYFNNCGISLSSVSHSNFGKMAKIFDNDFQGTLARILFGNWSQAIVDGNTISAQDFAGSNNNVSGIRCENGSSDIVISNNIAFKCTQNGIQVYQGTNIVISGNNCSDNLQSGIGLNTDSPTQYPSHVSIINNICSRNKYDGLDLKLPPNEIGATSLVQLVVSGNKCSENRACGIYLANAKGATVVGNVCHVNWHTGISLSNCRFVSVNSNFAYANYYASAAGPSTPNDSDYHGISLFGCSDCTVNGNIATNDGSGTTQLYGIRSYANCSRIIAIGNNAINNKTGGIKLDGTGNVLSQNIP